jgi:hypothetical protein
LETLDAPDEWEAHKALLRAGGSETHRTQRLPLALRGRLLDQQKRLTSKIA